jgi:hypothetical protein
MTTDNIRSSPNYFPVALQSALAAGLCLGFPAGLLLWLIWLRQMNHSTLLNGPIDFLHSNGLVSIYILVLSSLLWSYLIGRISGYQRWWRIAVASALGILITWFSPFSNVDGILYHARPDLPIHVNYAASMIGLVGSVTLFVGLAYGLVLRSVRAALTLGLTTSFVSLIVLIMTIFACDRLGLRVGTGNLAMPKVTAVGLMLSALMGGMVLGVGFTAYVRKSKATSFTVSLYRE